MPFNVVAFCGYYSGRYGGHDWRDDDYHPYKFVQALKNEELNLYARIPVRGRLLKLSNANREDAAKWFGMFAADYLTQKGISGPFLFVPVPNSGSLTAATIPTTVKLGSAVCDALKDGSVVLDCLRCKKNLGSAHKAKGPREPEILYPNLYALPTALKGLPEKPKIIVIDDVATKGGHLKACVAKLLSMGLKANLCICAAKTVDDHANPSFHTYKYFLDDYVPVA
jgi:hypothetical protein